jgi:hypothetical protein
MATALDQTRSFVERFVKASDSHLDVITLWAAHTHAVDVNQKLLFDTTPRLALLSDEPGSGKTRVLDLLKLLGRNAEISTDVTAASLFHATSEAHETVLLDEIDVLFGRGEAKATVRSIINSGYKRNGTVPRATKRFNVFAPLALAGLGNVFTTAESLRPTRSRCIIVRMVKKPGAEPLRSREHDRIGARIREDLNTWVGVRLGEITSAWPELPNGIEDRLAEVWEPLFMVAQAAGGSWPARVASACLELSFGAGTSSNEKTLSELLVTDLLTVFGDREVVGTLELIDRLYKMSPVWPSVWPQKGSATRELAQLLEPLGVEPTRHRVAGKQVTGYRKQDVEYAASSE